MTNPAVMGSQNPDEYDDHSNKKNFAEKEELKPEERKDCILSGSTIKVYVNMYEALRYKYVSISELHVWAGTMQLISLLSNCQSLR